MTTSPGIHNARVDLTRRVQVFLFIYLQQGISCLFYTAFVRVRVYECFTYVFR